MKIHRLMTVLCSYALVTGAMELPQRHECNLLTGVSPLSCDWLHAGLNVCLLGVS